MLAVVGILSVAAATAVAATYGTLAAWAIARKGRKEEAPLSLLLEVADALTQRNI